MGLNIENDIACCSFGLCTNSIMCKRNKVLNDYCDHTLECQPPLLQCISNQCLSKSD